MSPGNIFDPPPRDGGPAMQAAKEAREAALGEILAAFGPAPAAVAWLRACLATAERQPSYEPHRSFDLVAYNEGRKAALREILAAIDAALSPS